MRATLDQSYRHLTRLHRHHDPSGALATRRLPAVTRHHVHALAGFAAHAATLAAAPPDLAAHALAALADELDAAARAGGADGLTLRAVVHTHRAYGLDVVVWRELLEGLAPPPTLARRLDDARRLAALVAPVLEPTDPRAVDALGDLAVAAVLTRRLAAPEPDDADVEGVSRARALARARRMLVSADLGMPWLPPASARAARAHRGLLAATLDRVPRDRPGPQPASRVGDVGPPRHVRVLARWGR